MFVCFCSKLRLEQSMEAKMPPAIGSQRTVSGRKKSGVLFYPGRKEGAGAGSRGIKMGEVIAK